MTQTSLEFLALGDFCLSHGGGDVCRAHRRLGNIRGKRPALAVCEKCEQSGLVQTAELRLRTPCVDVIHRQDSPRTNVTIHTFVRRLKSLQNKSAFVHLTVL
jgi:hypothetical protein